MKQKFLILSLLTLFIVNIGVAQNDRIDEIATELSKYDIVTGLTSGFAGTVSPQYELFLELNTIASDAELLNLLSHESPVVVCYAYWAIDEKENDAIPSFIQANPNKNDAIIYLNGCVAKNYTMATLIDYLRYQPLLTLQ